MDFSGNAETSSRNAGGECGVRRGRHTQRTASFAGTIDDHVALFGHIMMLMWLSANRCLKSVAETAVRLRRAVQIQTD